MIETLVVLLVIAAIALVGIFVYRHHQNGKTVNASTTASITATKPKVSSSNKTVATVNPYAGWKTYTLKYEKLTFQYPSAWTIDDETGSQGLTTNADSVILTASDGYQVSIDDGWDGSGDAITLLANDAYPVKFAGSNDFIVPGGCGDRCKLSGGDTNSIGVGGILMTKATDDYSNNDFPQDRYAHGNPSINSGGSLMLIDGDYTGSNSKDYTTVSQVQNDPEFKNYVLLLESMHY